MIMLELYQQKLVELYFVYKNLHRYQVSTSTKIHK